jgi:hypothetical protein
LGFIELSVPEEHRLAVKYIEYVPQPVTEGKLEHWLPKFSRKYFDWAVVNFSGLPDPGTPLDEPPYEFIIEPPANRVTISYTINNAEAREESFRLTMLAMGYSSDGTGKYTYNYTTVDKNSVTLKIEREPDNAFAEASAIFETTVSPEIYEPPGFDLGGVPWRAARPVKYTPVFIIKSVDVAGREFTAERGYFQEPTGADVDEFPYQFQLVKTDFPGSFQLTERAALRFSELAEPAVELTLDELAAKVADGYVAWRFSASDGKISKLTNIPWRERKVYEVLELIPADDPKQLRVQARLQITYPKISDNTKYDPLGTPEELLNITPDTAIFTDRFYGSPEDAHYGEDRVPGDVRNLSEWLFHGRFALIETDDADALSIYGMYTS